MLNKNIENDLNAKSDLFKALGHPVRLLMINLLGIKPRHGEELAAILNLNPATISHHLTKLVNAGLLTSKKDQYYQVYSLESALLKKTLDEIIRLPQPGLQASVETDAYKTKVLATFFRQGRLRQIPTQQKKRLVIMEKIVLAFEPGHQYTEREVNQILLDFHEDVATLRRELVASKLMYRDKGIYWRE